MDPIYQVRRTKYLLMRQAVKDPPLALLFSLAEEVNDELCLNTEAGLMTRGEAFDRCEELETRLEASCAGLLEINHQNKVKVRLSKDARRQHISWNDYFTAPSGSRVQYLHRNVRDFFESEKYSKRMEKLVDGTAFDPKIALLRAWILRLKVLPHLIYDTLDFVTGCRREHSGEFTFTWGEAYIKDIIDEAMGFAQAAKLRSGMTQHILIEELQKTLHQFQKSGSRLQFCQLEQLGIKRSQSAGPIEPFNIRPQAEQQKQATKRNRSQTSKKSKNSKNSKSQKLRNAFAVLFCCNTKLQTQNEPQFLIATNTN